MPVRDVFPTATRSPDATPALINSGATLMTILASITDAVYILDAQWRFVYLNPQTEVMGQRSRAELLGTSIWDAYPETIGTAFDEQYHRAMATGVAATFEAFFAPLNLWVEVRLYPSESGLTAYCHDITARRTAEATLRASDAHFRAVVETLTDGVVVQNLDGAINTCNASAKRLLGMTVAQMEQRAPVDPGWQAFAADGLPLSAQNHPAMVTLRTGMPQLNALMSVQKPDGSITWLSVDTQLLHAPGATAPYAVVSALTDITARKAAAEALHASEASLAEAQRMAHLGNWEVDRATGAARWSAELYRMFGLPPGQGAPPFAALLGAIHPDDRKIVGAQLNKAHDDGAPCAIEYRVVHPDGAVRIVQDQSEVVVGRDGTARRVGAVLDITERRALEAQLQHQAFHDPLTGLPNRALFLDRLGQALARAGREGRSCALLFLDLDRFKDINDTRGHDVGDRLLLAVAARLRGALRDEDTLARLGGDEFTVLLETVAGADEAVQVAERIAAVLVAPFPLVGRAERVTASTGIVLSDAGHDRPESLLRDADVAMYRAKEAGRAGYALFDPAMQATLVDRLALERDLWAALDGDEFVLHYQPIVDLATGAVVEVEALLRWRHAERGLVPPDRFIPLAEACGAIRPLGRWVLRAACRWGRLWLDAHPDRPPLTLAVNLSAREFQDLELVGTVRATLAEMEFPAHLLRLEITESAAMGDAEAALRVLEALRALGVRLALDDFGTGFSSLAYLRRFPVDTLKIDRSFIRDLATNGRSGEIGRTIAALAATLHLAVTAEGLETADQVAWARMVGCDRGQGHYFARAMPAEELDALWDMWTRFDLPGVASPENVVSACGTREMLVVTV